MKTIWQPNFTNNDLDIIAQPEVYTGFLPIKRYELRYRTFEGSWSETIFREVLLRPRCAAVLPYDPVTEQVVLIEQFRIGGYCNDSSWLLEIVAGLKDNDESLEECAKRETLEETGCKLTDIVSVNDYIVTCGISNERTAVFLGRVDDPSFQDGKVFGEKKENEDIKVHVLKADEAFRLLQQGVINTASAVIALQWLQINKDVLHQKWLAS